MKPSCSLRVGTKRTCSWNQDVTAVISLEPHGTSGFPLPLEASRHRSSKHPRGSAGNASISCIWSADSAEVSPTCPTDASGTCTAGKSLRRALAGAEGVSGTGTASTSLPGAHTGAGDADLPGILFFAFLLVRGSAAIASFFSSSNGVCKAVRPGCCPARPGAGHA